MPRLDKRKSSVGRFPRVYFLSLVAKNGLKHNGRRKGQFLATRMRMVRNGAAFGFLANSETFKLF